MEASVCAVRSRGDRRHECVEGRRDPNAMPRRSADLVLIVDAVLSLRGNYLPGMQIFTTNEGRLVVCSAGFQDSGLPCRSRWLLMDGSSNDTGPLPSRLAVALAAVGMCNMTTSPNRRGLLPISWFWVSSVLET